MVVGRSSHSYETHLRHTYLDCHAVQFFTYFFLFLLKECKVFGFIVVCLFSFFSSSELSNFPLNSSFLRQHPSRYGLPICNDPKASSALIPG